MNIYQKMPRGIQSLGINCYALYLRIRRYNRLFRNEVERFRKNESLDAAGWERLKTERLQLLLLHAAKTVPHWRDLFKRIGLKNEDFK